MNLVNINVYGGGYYSGSSYEESIFLLEEDYKELGKDLDGIEVYLGELDGNLFLYWGDGSGRSKVLYIQ